MCLHLYGLGSCWKVAIILNSDSNSNQMCRHNVLYVVYYIFELEMTVTFGEVSVCLQPDEYKALAAGLKMWKLWKMQCPVLHMISLFILEATSLLIAKHCIGHLLYVFDFAALWCWVCGCDQNELFESVSDVLTWHGCRFDRSGGISGEICPSRL